MALDRSQFKRRRVDARVLFDGELIERHAQLDAALGRAIAEDAKNSANGSIDQAPLAFDLLEQIRALEARIEAEEKLFVFAGIGHHNWLMMCAEHPPTPADLELGFDFDPRTFPPVAVANSCVQSPSGECAEGEGTALELDDAVWLFESLDLAEWSKIWQSCLLANMGAGDRPKSLIATVAANITDRPSTTPRATASRSRGSKNGRTTTKTRRSNGNANKV